MPSSTALRRLTAARTIAAGLVLIAATASLKTASAKSSVPPKDSAACPQQPKVCLPRTTDEVWLVSSRCLGCPDMEAAPYHFEVWKYDSDQHQWNDSSPEKFLASRNPALHTVYWVHGNRKYANEAREDGMEIYRQLTAGVSGSHPIRFVIFSWPSTPIRGLREDAREKAARTNLDGYYLAWLVNQSDPHVPVDFIGYSFGARIVTGALHVLGGGELMGHLLPEPLKKRLDPMDCVLVAPAVNNDWLAIGHAHGQALTVVNKMLSLNNFCDMALKRYSVIDPCSKPAALGYTGAVGPLGENGDKLFQLNMCCAVGKQHYWGNYFYNGSIVARIRPYVGLAD